MRHWKNDKELFTLMKTYLYTAVVGDIMDLQRYLHCYRGCCCCGDLLADYWPFCDQRTENEGPSGTAL